MTGPVRSDPDGLSFGRIALLGLSVVGASTEAAGCYQGWMTDMSTAGRWRPMRNDDLAAVAAISDAVHGAAYTEAPAIYAERLALYPAGCHVFARGGAIDGYLIGHPWRRDDPPELNRPLGAIPPDADGYYLHDLALLPSARGTGAGRAALALALRQAAAAGFDDVTLTAVGGADAFWAAQGFAYVDREGPSPYGADTHLMRRTTASRG